MAPSLRDSVGFVGFADPTLKRGANNRCAYGAGNGPLSKWSAAAQAPLWAANHKASGSAGGYFLRGQIGAGGGFNSAGECTGLPGSKGKIEA